MLRLSLILNFIVITRLIIMNVYEANQNLVQLLKEHCMIIQGGKLGTPSLKDLDFIGKIHGFLERSYYTNE